MDELPELLASSYRNLYDLVRLRTDPLGTLLFPEHTLAPKQRAWKLHRLLLDTIDELKPGPDAPPGSRETRRHRLMQLRYVEALDPQNVASELAITRRHFYREHNEALEAVAGMLRESHFDSSELPIHQVVPRVDTSEFLTDQQQSRHSSYAIDTAMLTIILSDVVGMVEPLLAQRGVTIQTEVPESLRNSLLSRGSLRQVMLALLGFIADYVEPGTLRIGVTSTTNTVVIDIALAGSSLNLMELAIEQLRELNAVIATDGIAITPAQTDGQLCGFSIHVPRMPAKTILIVDDNEDLLLLYQSYLWAHNYNAVLANSGIQALEYAREKVIDCIVLDLMMPNQDGWDILQRLKNQVQTCHIPIIICSVLKQRNLAISLGAAEFIEKPITEDSLMTALNSLNI